MIVHVKNNTLLTRKDRTGNGINNLQDKKGVTTLNRGCQVGISVSVGVKPKWREMNKKLLKQF